MAWFCFILEDHFCWKNKSHVNLWSFLLSYQRSHFYLLHCPWHVLSVSEQYRECLDNVLKGPFSITLRNRLQCHVIRDAAKDELVTEEPILVLNEVTIDRGISSYLTYLECYCDSSFVTCVQGDGLIISTTSGSTAYSLAAGGSMVHPQVCPVIYIYSR